MTTLSNHKAPQSSHMIILLSQDNGKKQPFNHVTKLSNFIAIQLNSKVYIIRENSKLVR